MNTSKHERAAQTNSCAKWSIWGSLYPTGSFAQSLYKRVGCNLDGMDVSSRLDSYSEDKLSMANMGNRIEMNHHIDNLRYNAAAKTSLIGMPGSDGLSVESMLGYAVLNNEQLNLKDPPYILNEDEVLSYLFRKLESDKSNDFLGSLSKQLERANSKPPAHIATHTSTCTGHTLADIDYHITHKHGSRAIEAMLRVDGRLIDVVRGRVMKSFRKLVVNEFASRVMQVLAQACPRFRAEVLEIFRNDHDLWLKRISALFVMTSCMKYAKSCDEYSFVTHLLLSNRHLIIADKSRSRALISLIEVSESRNLNSIFDFMYKGRNWMNDLDDKFLTYIIIALIRRDYQPMLDMLKDGIQFKLPHLMRSTFFKLLMNKLLVNSSDHTMEYLNKTFISTKPSEMYMQLNAKSNRYHFYYYIFLTLSTHKATLTHSNFALVVFLYNLSSNDNTSRFDPSLKALISTKLKRNL